MKYIDNRLNAKIVKLEDANNNFVNDNVEDALNEIDSKIKNIETDGYDDTQLRQSINNIKTELGTVGLATTNKTIKGGINEVNSKIKDITKLTTTYNLLNEGCVADGVTDNKEKIEGIFNNLKSGDSVYIPYGTYLIKLTDNDLKDVGMTRKPMYPWIVLRNISNLNIFGEGILKFDCTGVAEKASILMFFDCPNLKLSGITLQGDVNFGSDVTYLETGLNGISLIRCDNSQVNGVKFHNILAALTVSGEINTPTNTDKVSKDVIVTNCLFKNYGQVSTFGSGVSRLIFSNNICINPMQSGFKVSTNVQGSIPLNKSEEIIFSNNIIYWESDYIFSNVGWDEGKKFCPVGFMIEGHSNNIKVTDNIIDLSKITDDLSNSISIYAPIVVFGTYVNNNLTNEGVEITNNKLYGINNSPSLTISPAVKSIIINDNELKGGIDFKTFTENNVGKTKGIYINNNVFLDDFYLYLKNVKTSSLVVKGNSVLNNSPKSFESIIFEENDIDYIIFKNNEFPNEILKTYNGLNCNNLIIENNLLQNIYELEYVASNGVINIKNNTFTSSNTTLTTLVISDDNTVINYSNNIGATNGSAIKINKGKLFLGFNSIIAKTGIQFSIGDSIVQSGFFTGSGAPSMDAGVGVMYRDLNAVTPALYLKIGDGTGSDKWKQI